MCPRLPERGTIRQGVRNRRPALAEDIKTAVRFLDDTIDANIYPLPAIELMHKGNRKIGLGVTGWADLLLRLGLPYNHLKSFALARTLMKLVRDTSRSASAELPRSGGYTPVEDREGA